MAHEPPRGHSPTDRLAAFADRVSAWTETPILAAIRTGVVAVVPLTIVGGLFVLLANPPIPVWNDQLARWRDLLQVPVAVTFGVLALFVCLAVAHDLAGRRGLDPLAATLPAVAAFLLLAVDPASGSLSPAPLGAQGILTAILVAVSAVELQRWLTRRRLVIRLPAEVPAVVGESFAALVPLTVLLTLVWVLRFGLGIDLMATVQTVCRPLLAALDTLPGILVYALLVTGLWALGINGDNALDAVVAPVFLQELAANTAAWEQGGAAPHVTALGFFTTFVNVGGTGGTLALALVLLRSRDPVCRRIARLSLPTQIFQINEPLFFGLPVVLNPLLMVPYVASAVVLTASTWALMEWNLIGRPVVNVPWTTPPVIGHYLVTGGDWRAAVWGLASIPLAMAIYWPFARRHERRTRASPPISATASPPISATASPPTSATASPPTSATASPPTGVTNPRP
ncbi:MAG: PTS sugar transporter subunit IIC [Pirellulales bacterium]